MSNEGSEIKKKIQVERVIYNDSIGIGRRVEYRNCANVDYGPYGVQFIYEGANVLIPYSNYYEIRVKDETEIPPFCKDCKYLPTGEVCEYLDVSEAGNPTCNKRF